MHKLSSASLTELTFVSDPRPHPELDWAVAVVTRITEGSGSGKDYKAPAYESHLERISLEDGSSRPFTSGTSDTAPRFSPDGRLVAFLSKRNDDDAAQVYVMPSAGGEARRLTEFKAGVSGFCWQPDSAGLALVTRLDHQETARQEGRGVVIDRIQHKADGLGLRPSAISALVLLDLDGEHRVVHQPPTEPAQPVFSQDGACLWFMAAASLESQAEFRRGIWCLELADLSVRQVVSDEYRVQDFGLAEQLVFLAGTSTENPASPTGVWLLEESGPRLLTGEQDAMGVMNGDSRQGSHSQSPVVSADSVIVNLSWEGRSLLHRIPLQGGAPQVLTEGDRTVTGFSGTGGRLLFTVESADRPGEVHLLQDGDERRLTGLNDDFCNKYQLQNYTELADKAWVLEPAEPRADRAVVLEIHGGPHTSYGHAFMFDFQLLGARGYRVAFSNPPGSSGYGEAHASAILGRYGTSDADYLLALARKLARDNVPVHVTGGSYGGFMTNWLVGQTGLFRSAVTERSICNFVSFYGTSDIGYRFSEYEVGGNPWYDTERLWQQSPLRLVANITTPLLILHSDQDLRCPLEQAEQLFTALKRIGQTETRLVRFPEENHELSRSGRPDRRIQRLDEILAWFENHA